MLTDYCILVAATSTATLVFRELKRSHPSFKRFVTGLPLIGESLGCGFCISLWMSLAAVLLINPISAWQPQNLLWLGSLLPLAQLLIAWFAVGVGVLILRSATIVLLNLSGLTTHQHDQSHASH